MPGVTVRDDGVVRWIMFDRPEVLNALTLADVTATTAAILDAGATSKAIVFTGAGRRAFSSGMHTETFADLTPVTARRVITSVGALLQAVRQAPIPTVAMINGYCIGAAFELALACDLRISVRDARFGLPEIKLGIPSVLEARLLQEHIGLSKAKEMILTGDLYPAEVLDRFGALNVVTSPARLEEETARMLSRLTSHTRAVLAGQKRLFDVWLNQGVDAANERSIQEFARTFEDDDTRAAVAAYRP